MNIRWHKYFMDVALRTAQLSYARRLKVGCVAVRDKRIIACGFNGTPPGEDNNCEHETETGLVTKDNVVHAEVNLIKYAKTNNIDLQGCSLFITHSCCSNCASAIVQAGFKEVFFNQAYRDNAGLDILKINMIPAITL